MKTKKIKDGIWEFQDKDMNVPARIYANDTIYNQIEDGVKEQIANVAKLPGVVDHVCVMPDGHFGYGFPIGGVAAFNLDEGIISPGGVGYDINCGVRLLASNLEKQEVQDKLKPLVDSLFENIPSGLGSKSRLRVSQEDLRQVCENGAKWAIENNLGEKKDLENTEEAGCIPNAIFEKISTRAIKRGRPQLGTLGSGNHFLELQYVDEIYDEDTAKKFGINHQDQVMVMIHCGSRGLGYQVADDFIKVMLEASRRQNINLADPQLACAKLGSNEADDYLGAMFSAVNYAFTNRQCIASWVRETFTQHIPHAKFQQVYDVCHNIAKFEEHGAYGTLCVHRKGATRAFSKGRKEIPKHYRDVGQPVIVPGDMGTSSYILVGLESSMNESFGSICHGAGRVLSRASAKRQIKGEEVAKGLEEKGEYIRAASMNVLAEEASQAYKDIDDVVASIELSNLAGLVAKVRPLGIVKG